MVLSTSVSWEGSICIWVLAMSGWSVNLTGWSDSMAGNGVIRIGRATPFAMIVTGEIAMDTITHGVSRDRRMSETSGVHID